MLYDEYCSKSPIMFSSETLDLFNIETSKAMSM